ncbi:uncharacterized protein LOC110847364 [Folsomia candida]|uniref:uncharacterized protein LOC110847364 n=1 Tax=Folsomia candida TaxID=158441 RepID=UPI000B9036FE|nr:uncharacterized protein LOC110847364 [Folsomia candida]
MHCIIKNKGEFSAMVEKRDPLLYIMWAILAVMFIGLIFIERSSSIESASDSIGKEDKVALTDYLNETVSTFEMFQNNISKAMDLLNRFETRQNQTLEKIETRQNQTLEKIETRQNQTLEKMEIRLEKLNASQNEDKAVCSNPASFYVNKKSGLSNLLVMGTHADGSTYFGCRVRVDATDLLGTYNLKFESCYYARWGAEYVYSGDDIDVFTNRHNANLMWKRSIDSLREVVVGGRSSSGSDVLVIRCRHAHGGNGANTSWIPGYFQNGEAVYNVAGKKYSCNPANLEFLTC